MTLDNRVVLITGASKGLGREIEFYFGSLGCRVACVARTTERLEATAKAIRDAGGSALAIPADVTRQVVVERLVLKVIEVFGAVDVLCDCVGMLGPKMDLVEYLDESGWDEAL